MIKELLENRMRGNQSDMSNAESTLSVQAFVQRLRSKVAETSLSKEETNKQKEESALIEKIGNQSVPTPAEILAKFFNKKV